MDLIHIVGIGGLHMCCLQFNPRITLEVQQVDAVVIYETATKSIKSLQRLVLAAVVYRTSAGQNVVPGGDVMVFL
jgi:hypothetical protein